MTPPTAGPPCANAQGHESASTPPATERNYHVTFHPSWVDACHALKRLDDGQVSYVALRDTDGTQLTVQPAKALGEGYYVTLRQGRRGRRWAVSMREAPASEPQGARGVRVEVEGAPSSIPARCVVPRYAAQTALFVFLETAGRASQLAWIPVAWRERHEVPA